ncbi:hypothetical protein [Rhodopirellula bahusiensis]|uniref:hypothetical protein n=1 Tax=Rhodopirellula bahusiensis TaxID=2014065 RepID=UPI003263F6AA
MAKATTTKLNPPRQQSTTDDKQDPADVAAASIRAITGCGVPESKRRVEALPTTTINAIAKAEAGGKRNQVPDLIAKAKAPKPKA